MVFATRRSAGRQLAAELDDRRWVTPLVLALPRGGVPVAAEIASAVDAPLDVFVARKVGAPGHREYGIGAIAEHSDQVVWSDGAARMFDLGSSQIADVVAAERRELERRIRRYRPDRPLPDLDERDVILVDDGLATGVTAEAALRSISTLGPRSLTLAVPVGAADAVDRLSSLAVVVCPSTPRGFRAVGLHYDDFAQVSDAEVLQLLGDV